MTLCKIPRTKSAKKLVRPKPLDRNEEDLSKMVHRALGTFTKCVLKAASGQRN